MAIFEPRVSQANHQHFRLVLHSRAVHRVTSPAQFSPLFEVIVPSSIKQAHAAVEHRSSPNRFCLLGIPSCLSLDQKAPAPCSVSTERCVVDGRVIKLVD